MPHRRGAVVTTTREPTRRVSERRRCRDGVRATQAHPALDHQHYKDLTEKNYKQYTHDALLPTAPAQPGLVMWGRKRSDAVMVVSAVEVRSRRPTSVPSLQYDSCPSHNEVGGLFFEFEAVRAASSDRDVPRRCKRPKIRSYDGFERLGMLLQVRPLIYI